MTDNTLELWPGGYRYYKDGEHFPLGMDSVLLAAFARTKPRMRVLDLGTGGGYIPLMLLGRQPGLTIDAIDIVPSAVTLAEGNARLNGLEEKIHPVCGDIRTAEGLIDREKYDMAICNPPYFDQNAGAGSKSDNIRIARSEGCTVFEVCSAAAFALKNGGTFHICWKPSRMAELFAALHGCGLEPKRLRFCENRAGEPPYLMLLQAKKRAGSGLIIEPPLVIRDGAGEYTEEILEIYHRKD